MSVQEEGFSSRFFTVLQFDATACCNTGFMFFLSDDKKYPEDYPAEQSEIEIAGEIRTGEIDGIDILYVYCDNYEIINEEDV